MCSKTLNVCVHFSFLCTVCEPNRTTKLKVADVDTVPTVIGIGVENL